MDKKIKTTELTIFGIVQGVGFRWATIKLQKKWAFPDGSKTSQTVP